MSLVARHIQYVRGTCYFCGMTHREQLSDYWSTAMSRRFWIIASLFYAGALLTNLAFVLGDNCGFAFIRGAQPLFMGMILVLVVFEWWAYRRYRANMTSRTGIGLLIAHMVLFEVTSAFDCAATTTFLYLLIPFMAYLYLDKWSAIGLAAVYSVWFATYFQVFRVDSFDDYLFRFVVFELGIVLGLAMASAVKEVLVSQAEERRLHSELENAHDQLEAYATQVKELGASEERNRLARDIHDGIGHYLAAITVQLEKALAFRSRDPSQSERAILDAREAARDALRDVRRSVGALRESAEFFSLAEALQDLVRRSPNDGLNVDLKIEGAGLDYSIPSLLALYRVAQESLTNVSKHASASRTNILLQMGDETAMLTVEDNGTGFDVTRLVESSQNNYGLHGMRERLELLEGHLTIESSPQSGTKLVAVVPKQPWSLSEEVL